MQSTPPPHAPARLVAAGLLALAVAMGIGRFAFTPLLPLMLRDGELDAIAGAEWAMANYIGYLAGALTAARIAREPRRAAMIGLAGVALSTLAIGVLPAATLGLAGPLLRGAAGVFSAWVLVGTSGWCLVELAKARHAKLGAWIYTGVGCGIAVAGTLAWLGGGQPARWLWLELGALAAIGAAWVTQLARVHHNTHQAPDPTPPPTAPPQREPTVQARGTDTGFVLCYGAFGYGYIVLATFLPAMARQSIDHPLAFGLTWPVFGIAAAVSVALTARWCGGFSRPRVWALAQAAMAVGTALPLLSAALGTLIVSAVLVGGTFMVTTMAGLQLARERHPANPTPLVARMTIAFAAGQIAGPLLIRALKAHPVAGLDALEWANLAATAMLAASAAWLWMVQPRRDDSA
jgi:MFS family permease